MTVLTVAAHVALVTYAIWFIVGSVSAGLPVFLIVNRKKRWVARAHRLARESGIDLPSRLVDRVAKRLRKEWLVSLAFYPLLIGPWQILALRIGIQDATFWDKWFPRLAMLLPILAVVCAVSTVVVAHWNEPGPVRLSHLRGIRLRDAFTATERLALMTGAVGTGGGIAWGLIQIHSPRHWWILDFAAIAVAAALWWRMEIAVLRHPSTASDEAELRWDDLFRFRRVRSLAIGAAWLPPTFIFLLKSLVDQQLTHFRDSTMLLAEVVVAGAVVVYLTFRHGPQLGRSA